MKVLALVFAAAIVAVNASNQCPKDEEFTWNKDILLEHEFCNKFYKCTFGQPVEMLCANGLFFNHELGICDWKQNVDCGNRNIPDDTQNSGENDDGASDDNNEQGDGNENEEGDVGEIGDICDLPGKELPESDLLENGCPIDPTVHWLLPNEDDCNQFYYCVNGAKIPQTCFGPLHFNRRLQVCDLPMNACCAKSFNKHVVGRRILMKK